MSPTQGAQQPPTATGEAAAGAASAHAVPPERALVTIGAAAAITGVAAKTIRYYADLGLLPPSERSKGGYRLFSVDDLWRLELVRTLRDLDFGLDEIGRLLAGTVPAHVAVALQRHAVGLRRRQLARNEVVLARAESDLDELDDDAAIEVLRGLTATFAEEAEERRRFVIQAAATLAEHRAADKADEPAALIAARHTAEPLWEAMAARGVDPEHFSADLAALRDRAEVLAHRARDPAEADALAEDLLALVLGQDRRPEAVAAVVQQAPVWLAGDDVSAAVAMALGRTAELTAGERLLLDALDRRRRSPHEREV